MVYSGSMANWRRTAERAADEHDPHKLILLVRQLCSELDDQQGPPLSQDKRNEVEGPVLSNDE